MNDAEGLSPAIPAAAAVPAGVLGDGEAIILAIKPSMWFIVIESWPVLAIAAAVAIVTQLSTGLLSYELTRRTIFLVCALAAIVRMTIATWEWIARLYVLTNLRVMRIRGSARPIVQFCPLKDLRHVHITATLAERTLLIGTIVFDGSEKCDPDTLWANVNQPEELRQTIVEAARRAGASVHS